MEKTEAILTASKDTGIEVNAKDVSKEMAVKEKNPHTHIFHTLI